MKNHNDSFYPHFNWDMLTFLALFTMLISAFNVSAATSIQDYASKEAITIKGAVTDETGIPLAGVTVNVKNTRITVITDANGRYSIKSIPDNAILVFTFIGMSQQTVPVDGKPVIDIVMRTDEHGVKLEETVVVGYGKQKVQSVVGAIAQTSGEEVVRTSKGMTDLRQGLAANLPGVLSITNSGEPGGTGTGNTATRIYIRGMNTWNGGQPLILVDGVERPLENVEPNEVETISVLKDASATAVFGVKGANGVILVTTKRGKLGKPSLTFNSYTTGNMLSKLPSKLGSYDAIIARNEAIEREAPINEASWQDYIPFNIATRYKRPQSNPDYAMIYPDVDWQKALFKDMGFSHRSTVSLRGSSKFTRYFGSISFVNENDLYKEYKSVKTYAPDYNFNRFNFRSNFDFSLTKTTTLKFNLSGYYSKKNTSRGASTSSMMTAIYGMAPDLFIPQYPDGTWGYNLDFQKNPIAELYNLGIQSHRRCQMNSDFNLEQKLDFIIKGLSANVSFSVDNSIGSLQEVTENAGSIRPDNAYANVPLTVIDPLKYRGSGQDPSEYMTHYPLYGINNFDWIQIPWGAGSENLQANIERRMLFQAQINYNNRFKKHSVNAMGVFKREEYAMGDMFKKYREDWVFRAAYDYDLKYLFEVNGAYNGSEQFGPDYRFDFFPSMAIGWNISREKFFKIDWVNNLKIRFSRGLVGDDKVSSDRWLYMSQWKTLPTKALLSSNLNQNSPYPWYAEDLLGNPDIHWEKALKNDFGVELGIINNMVTVSYDYYTEDRKDILLAGSSRSMPSYFGIAPPSINIGRVKSKGHELEIKFDSKNKKRDALHYWATVALAHNENKVIFKDDPLLYPAYKKAEGYMVNQIRTYVRSDFYGSWDDVFASVPIQDLDNLKAPGFYNLIDFDGDGIIESADDQIPKGYSDVPKNTGSISLGADYNGFSIMAQFYGVSNVTRMTLLNSWGPTNSYNLLYEQRANYWAKDNLDATSSLPRWKVQGGNLLGDFSYSDASYVRLKSIEIAYTAHEKFVKSLGINSLRLFVNGNNLFFWSKLPDDNEGYGNYAYPTVKRINVGFDLNF